MTVESKNQSTMTFVLDAASLVDENKQEADSSSLELLVELAARKRTIAAITFAAAIVGLILVALLPNRYTATASILPPQQTQSAASVLMSQLNGMAAGSLASLTGKDLGLKSPNDIYIGMLKSRTVQDSLIHRFDLIKVYRAKDMTDARKDLEKWSDLASGKDGFITVSVTDKDRGRAAALANAYVQELRNTTQTLAVTEASQRRLFYEGQVEAAKESLSQAEFRLKDTQQKTGLVQLDDQAKAMLEGVAAVRAQIVVKEVELQSMKAYATDNNTDVQMLHRELAALKEQLAKMESKNGESQFDVPIGKMPDAGLEYIRRVRDLKYKETVFELLAKQLEIARLDEVKDAALIQVVDPAISPEHKSSPKRLLILLISGAFGFICALAFVFFQHMIEHAKADPTRAILLHRLFASLRPRFRKETLLG